MISTHSYIKKLVAIGSLSAIFGFGYSYFFRGRPSKVYDQLSPDTIIKILKALRRELYPIFKKMEKASQTIRMASQQENRNMAKLGVDSSHQIKTIEFYELADFRNLIHQTEKKIYERYGITRINEFQRLTLQLQTANVEIKSLIDEIGDMYTQAKQGKIIQISLPLPPHITELSVLYAQKELHCETLRAIKLSLEAAHETETSAYINSNAIQAKIDQEHEKVYKKYGFDSIEDYHPENVFEQACLKYSATNVDFVKKLQMLDHYLSNTVNQMINGHLSLEALEEEFSRIDRFINPTGNIFNNENPSNIQLVEKGILNFSTKNP